MSPAPASIGPGKWVRLHLSIHLAEGTEAMSTFGDEPVSFRVGDGTLLPDLERLLNGLAAGDDQTFLLDGSDIYGPRDKANIHWVPQSDFPPHLAEVQPGQVIAFATPRGDELAGIVLEVEPDRTEVDFNHPLAGRSLTVRAKILEVADASGTGPAD